MSHTITVRDKDIVVECEAGETVLDAMERAGFAIPYSCRKGVCASCEGGLCGGEAQVRGQGHLTGPQEGVKLCQARPLTDIEIAPARIRKVDPVERKVLPGKVRKIQRLAEDVAAIHLRFPIGNRAPFRAGQYLRVMLPDGDSRNYSMANPPQKNDALELHIRHVPGGKFSESILARLAPNDVLEVELPYGEFTLTEAVIPALLVATGTGFAPIRSIIENQVRSGAARPLHLYWGGNGSDDIYMRAAMEALAERHVWFTFTPVVSGADAGWQGRRGFVHEAVLEDYPDMAGLEVYACGAPVMIEAARRDFCAKAGLDPDLFFSDAFVPSGDAEAVPA
ncbi:FAD-binding oxidoreductase [Mesorhizobium xinjiangense]|uniref:FAD-binding oxidoreductase n=1 Tax=Mesorhizobium xinjiangense TaxID=2678685 RepID=UPI0012EECA23|nr:FAD-binding oxidoreductase [Mesorhizobium xinjiangense]